MKTEFVYKIRRKSDGLFSSGGSSPNFTKTGKVWRDRRALNLHLNMLLQYPHSDRGITQYKDCEVITLVTEVTDYEDIGKYIGVVKERRDEREQERQERMDRWREDQRRKKYEELRAHYEHGVEY